MADSQDEMSMNASGSTSVEELGPTGLNENSTEDSRQGFRAEMMANELWMAIFEYLSIPERLHFRFVPFQGASILYFLGEFHKESNRD
jgi:hypothetical protein